LRFGGSRQNLNKMSRIKENKIEPELRPSAPISSSILDLENSKTTTGDRELSADHPNQLPPQWAEVDLTTEAGIDAIPESSYPERG
jgi:hypothetical protein